MQRKKICFLILFLIPLIQISCSSKKMELLETDTNDIKRIEQRKKDDFAHLKAFQVHENIYLGSGEKVKISELESKLPVLFDKKIVLIENPLTLYQIANKITQTTGISVQISSKINKTDKTNKKNKNISNKTMQLSYGGKLNGLLDVIAAHYCLSWEYDNTRKIIRFYNVKTKTFNIVALNGDLTTDVSILNNNDSQDDAYTEAGGGASNESKQETRLTSNMSVWEVISRNINSMLTPSGSVVINQAAGSVTVTDTVNSLNNIESYIDTINKKLSRQVSIEVKVFSVTKKKLDNHGLNINGIFKNTGESISLVTQSANPINMLSGTGSLTAKILEGAKNSSGGISHFIGSDAVVNYLKNIGDVELVTSGSGITLNNQPMPIQNIKRTGYLAEVDVTNTTDVGTSTKLKPGQVTTGFSMIVTPHILDNNKVILQYSITLSSLDKMDTIKSGEQSIQTPNVSSRSFFQRVALKTGSTLVLAGFEHVKTINEKAFGIFGYGRKKDKDKQIIVVSITVNEVNGA